ncbi:P-type DNA transfer ATPase VirB11 [Achromobacter ruhlandii]|uniref:P-type DNA transfer ATPase VirB11 n=1 Tax=Achromobacter ruhlandii TaxID=72557 RepID=UPI003B9F82AD
MSSEARNSNPTIDALMARLDPHLLAPGVTELAMNRYGEVWQKSFQGWTPVADPKLDLSFTQSLATALAAHNKQNVGSVMYLVMPRGERATVITSPAVIDDTLSLLIRRHMPINKSLEDLQEQGAFNDVKDMSFNDPTAAECEEYLQRRDFAQLQPFEAELLALKRERNWVEFLRMAVRHHRNIVIAGKTESGKTVMARSLIDEIPTTERLITIEDTHELTLPKHENKVHMIYERKGPITPQICIESCMRQSADRILVSEIRGSEAWDYLTALNTGHEGGIATTHANNARATYSRLASLVKASEVGKTLDYQTIRDELTATIHLVLFLRRRKVVEVFYDPIYAREELNKARAK